MGRNLKNQNHICKKDRSQTNLNIQVVAFIFVNMHYRDGKCPKILNTLFHTFFGLNFAYYAVVS